jgi:hypothetical protein
VSQPAIDAFEPRNLGSKKRDFYTRDSVSRFFLVDRSSAARREKNIHLPPTPATDPPPNASPALPAPRRR